MSIRRPIALLTVLLSVVAPPVAAQAQATQAPPGNAGVDEYLETVPGSKGSGSAGGTGVAPKLTPGADRVIPKTTLSTLASKGEDGKAAAALAEATSPKSGEAPRQGASKSSGSPSAPAPPAGGQRPPLPAAADGDGLDAIGRVLAADSGDGGLGLLLPVGMIVVLAAAIGIVLLRRRSAA